MIYRGRKLVEARSNCSFTEWISIRWYFASEHTRASLSLHLAVDTVLWAYGAKCHMLNGVYGRTLSKSMFPLR